MAFDEYTNSDSLEEMHTPEAIAKRLDEQSQEGYLGDFILGAVDGVITTFAIVSGAAGAGFDNSIALILGVSNVFADGLSMAASNFLKARSDREHVQRFRKIEAHHIEYVPDAEVEEVRQIYYRKGFRGELLEEIVSVICADKERWIDTMITEEWGLPLSQTNPKTVALVTFTAFVIAGCIPLIPLVFFFSYPVEETFLISVISTICCFFGIGWIRGLFAVNDSPLKTALETVLIGGSAAGIAYGLGYILHEWLHLP